MDEPKLTGTFIVGSLRFGAGVKLSTAQGAVDRLHDRFRRMEAALHEVMEFEARLPDSLRKKIEAAFALGSV